MLSILFLLIAQQPASPPPRLPVPKAGVCPLPTLPALPGYAETAFHTVQAGVPHGEVQKVEYGAGKRMHVYLPPGYEASKDTRYPVLYLNHGGGDDDTKWTNVDARSGGNAHVILDNLIAAGKANPMIVVMPSTKGCASGVAPELGKDDACTKEYLQGIIPHIDGHYRTKASREGRELAGLSMGGFVVLQTGLPHLETFSELYVYSSGHIGEASLQKFADNFAPLLKDPGLNDRFRVPLYMANGETDIAL